MLSRREFLRRCRDISIAVAASPLYTNEIAHGFIKLAESAKPKVMFIQSQCCTGCSISATYGNEFDFIDFITRIINLQVHPNLSFAQGHSYIQQIKDMTKEGGYYLVLEGSIPLGIPEACMIDDMPMSEFLKPIVKNAGAVVSNGTCASYGGIPASNMNVTGAVSVEKYLSMNNINTPMIKIPGCPIQPDRLMGTVAYIVATGKLPELVNGTPKKYFGELIHNACGRYKSFANDQYINKFAHEHMDCLLKKGCRGPVTFADCPTRRWNGKTNVCIEANTPCVGCVNPDFPFNEPMYLNASTVTEIPWSNLIKDLSGK